MNIEFLRVLQSIAEVEKNPLFRSKKYRLVEKEERRVNPDEVPVVLKYPDNVVVVASPTGKAPPPAFGENRVTKLSEALVRASFSSFFGFKGCSIVVHDGMYIDPLPEDKLRRPPKEGFSLEIIGVEEVRILLNSTYTVLFHAPHVKLALKNLSIYENCEVDVFTQQSEWATIALWGGQLSLVDVRMRGSNLCVFGKKGCEFEVSDCVFSNYPRSFQMMDSKADFRNTLWYHNFAPENQVIGDCVAIGVICNGNSNVTFDRCQFIRQPGFEGETNGTACQVVLGARMRMTDCLISGFWAPFDANNTGSKAVLNRCEIIDCHWGAVCSYNSSASVTDCKLEVDVIMFLQYNEAGEIIFLRNSIKPGPKIRDVQPPDPPLICLDRVPKKLEQDIDGVNFKVFRSNPNAQRLCVGATRKSREDYAEYCRSSSVTKLHGSLAPDVRHCVRCYVNEKRKPEAKFQYCIRCRSACYCSKECQLADWPDHKLACKKV